MRHISIYLITCPNGATYVGSTLDMHKRKGEHLANLRRQEHPNKRLQAIYNEHGADALHFQVLETCHWRQRLEREQHYIDTLKPSINIAPKAGSTIGLKHTEETKKRLSEMSRSRPRIAPMPVDTVKVERFPLEFIEKHIQAWLASGLSKGKYALRNGLTTTTFYKWCRERGY